PPGDARWVWGVGLGPVDASVLLALWWVTSEPMISGWIRRFGREPFTLPQRVGAGAQTPVYQRILAPLDLTDLDRETIRHAAAMARLHHARLYLLHVEEGVTSQVYAALSATPDLH